MMQKMIEAIDAEEKADVEKKTFCEDEQAVLQECNDREDLIMLFEFISHFQVVRKRR